MALKWASSRAKWRTALQRTTSKEASGKESGSMGSDAEVFGGAVGDEMRRLRERVWLDGVGVVVDGEDLVAFAEEIDEVAAGAAAGVEDSHAGDDVAAEELVEEVDVDGAELLLERWA